MSDETRTQVETTTFEDEKRHLECEKLRLEIAQLQNWKRRAILQPATLIAAFAALAGWGTGLFTVMKDTSTLNRERAAYDIQKLNDGKTALNEEIRKLSGERDALANKNSVLGVESKALLQRQNDLQANVSRLDARLKEMRNRNARWQSDLGDVSKRLDSLPSRIMIASDDRNPQIALGIIKELRNELKSIAESMAQAVPKQ
ncbi:MAG: hypothetical protein FJW32_08115 [Acidobacteria bacterium]|nr:hypothetical protein [Acidobacteriota bacterium]